MRIPGFTRYENLIFDISYNRSFTKNCFKHKKIIKQIEKEDNNKLMTEEEKKKKFKRNR